MFVLSHTVVVHALETTHRSLEPVSTRVIAQYSVLEGAFANAPTFTVVAVSPIVMATV